MPSWTKTTFTPALIYSGIIGGIYILNAVIVDAMDINFTVYDSVSKSLVLIGGIIVAIYAYRKEYNNNLITYGRALSFGFLTSVLLAFVVAIYTWLFIKFINTDYIALMNQNMEEHMLAKGVAPEMIERFTERSSRMRNPGVMFFRNVAFNSIIGLIISLIAAIFLKKEPNSPFADAE